MFDPNVLEKLPYLPVTQVGETLIARHRETLELALITNTQTGPAAEMMSDDVALKLALEIIRETGRRAERTATLVGNLHQNLQRVLEAQVKERDNAQDQGDPAGAGNGASAGGNGASGAGRQPDDQGGPGQDIPGDQDVPSSRFGPCSPRERGLPGTGGPAEGSSSR